MQFKKILITLTSLVLINFMSQAVAQDEEETDGLANVVHITAKEGHEKALEDGITAYHHYMADKPGAWRYQWYSITTGPDSGSYLARSGNHDYADFDATNDWDDAAGAKFASDVAPHIASAIATITRTDDELGIWPESMADYSLFSVTQWHIEQGKGRQFNEGLKKIDATLKAGNWANFYAFVRPVSGGNGNAVTLVSPRKNFADMAPKDPNFRAVMNEAMGEDETSEFLAEWSMTYEPGQNMLLRYRAELSDYGDGN
jgi:hypothetical protein